MPLDLHVLGLPLAFILSQDQTLHCKLSFVFAIRRRSCSDHACRFLRLFLSYNISKNLSGRIRPVCQNPKAYPLIFRCFILAALPSFPFLANRDAKVSEVFQFATGKENIFLIFSASVAPVQGFYPYTTPSFQFPFPPFASIGSANISLFSATTIPSPKKNHPKP